MDLLLRSSRPFLYLFYKSCCKSFFFHIEYHLRHSESMKRKQSENESPKHRKPDWDMRLWKACEEGNRDKAEQAVSKGANTFGMALWHACQGGHDEMIQFAIDNGTTNWDFGLCGACEGGHEKVARDMIRRGAREFIAALVWACRGGHKALVQFMLAQGARLPARGFLPACEEGHTDVVEFLLDKGVGVDMNKGLEMACENRHVDTIRLLAKRGAKVEDRDDFSLDVRFTLWEQGVVAQLKITPFADNVWTLINSRGMPPSAFSDDEMAHEARWLWESEIKDSLSPEFVRDIITTIIVPYL